MEGEADVIVSFATVRLTPRPVRQVEFRLVGRR